MILKKRMLFGLIGSFVLSFSMRIQATDIKNVPNYMQPDSVIIYDNELNYQCEKGGEADNSKQEISDVEPFPGMKAVYDDEGLLRNVYYPDGDGGYQLSPPITTYNNTGVRKKGSGKWEYGKCFLNFKADKVVGKGQITYYGKPDEPSKTKFKGDHNVNGKPYYLKMGDCATKWKGDDVPTGVKVKAKNLKNNKVKTFKKEDCGELPNAILDIFEDGTWSNKGICGLTVGGVKDSVDNGKIVHSYTVQ